MQSIGKAGLWARDKWLDVGPFFERWLARGDQAKTRECQKRIYWRIWTYEFPQTSSSNRMGVLQLKVRAAGLPREPNLARQAGPSGSLLGLILGVVAGVPPIGGGSSLSEEGLSQQRALAQLGRWEPVWAWPLLQRSHPASFPLLPSLLSARCSSVSISVRTIALFQLSHSLRIVSRRLDGF